MFVKLVNESELLGVIALLATLIFFGFEAVHKLSVVKRAQRERSDAASNAGGPTP